MTKGLLFAGALLTLIAGSPAAAQSPYVQLPYVQSPYVQTPYVQNPYLQAPSVQTPFAQGGCYSDAQISTAVQQGRAKPLSSLLPAVLARFGGQIAGSPQLCTAGSRLVYIVTLLVGGQARQVQIDAVTGAAN